ncbi:MAG: CARDB domain-containing protein [Thermoanaerobaculaceae bacterium]|nr:CARDB domain-containing protein [Thermoanaerobaculaceae bacterium]
MTLPLVRGLQRGKLAPVAILTVIGLGLLAWRSPGNGQQSPSDEPIRAVSLAGPAAVAAGSTVFMISNSAHSTGAKGTNWWTDVEFHNPTTAMASYTMALLKRNTDNSSPQTVSFMLNPGSSQRYTDVINTVFGFNGAAAILVTVNSGSVIVTSVTYNRLGPGNPGNFPDGSTFGQYVPAFTDDQAITAGDQGRIIQLSHEPSLATAFRTNIGLVNAAVTPVAVTLNLYDKFGNSLGPAVPVNLRGLEFQQLDRVFEQFTNQVVADGYAIVRTTTPGGRFFAYASVIDNRTGDPVCLPAFKVIGGTLPPTPTPTPTSPPAATPTPTPTTPPTSGIDLTIYRPSSWANCVVCNYRQNGPPPVTESLVAGSSTYVYWSVANLGTATVTQPITFGFYLDGTLLSKASWDPNTLNPPGLPASTYVTFNPMTYTVPTTGQHTISVTVDPDGQIADVNRSNNGCGFTGTWTGTIPTPTPVPTPGAVANPISTATWIFSTLLPVIGTTYPTVDAIVSSALTTGVTPLINQFVAADPVHRFAIANGVQLVFGSGAVTQYGTFTGSATLTFSNFQATSSSFSANYAFSTTSDFSLNGQRNAIPTASGTITASQTVSQAAAAGMDATAQSGVTTVVDATVIGSGTNPPATESGNIHFDTSKCAKFPVSGTINVTVGSDRYVISFNTKCDGSFDSQTNPPAQSCNAGQQVAGSDTPDSRSFEMGRTSATFQFDYETYSQQDRIQVYYEGNVIYDTGCVGKAGTVYPTYSGQSTVVQVVVTPNCAGGSGTSWNYTVHCPT